MFNIEMILHFDKNFPAQGNNEYIDLAAGYAVSKQLTASFKAGANVKYEVVSSNLRKGFCGTSK